MAHTVFVYGTLLSEEIVKILLNRNPESYAGATLLQYSIEHPVHDTSRVPASCSDRKGLQ